jgi:hypothetical protein
MTRITLPKSLEPHRAEIQALYDAVKRPWVGMVDEAEHPDKRDEEQIAWWAQAEWWLRCCDHMFLPREQPKPLTRN